jgi:hypothetical protein
VTSVIIIESCSLAMEKSYDFRLVFISFLLCDFIWSQSDAFSSELSAAAWVLFSSAIVHFVGQELIFVCRSSFSVSVSWSPPPGQSSAAGSGFHPGLVLLCAACSIQCAGRSAVLTPTCQQSFSRGRVFAAKSRALPGSVRFVFGSAARSIPGAL